MSDEIAKLNVLLKKVIAYGPSKKNEAKQKKRIKRMKKLKRSAPA
jgi:hypothetical protein